MRETILFILLILVFNIVGAQLVVSGNIKDSKNRPVSGASIAVKDSYDGTTSDSAGNFRFNPSEKGSILVQITAMGYKPFEVYLEPGTAGAPLVITLKEAINEMQAVTISAGSFEASDKKRATALTSVDMLTTASSNADVSAAVKTLPGAQQVGESEGLFVRGGTASETATYIDGNLVNNFFYSSVPNIAQRGRFTPWLFKGTVFSAGGYSALYGQALSSALILETKDLPEVSSATLGISPLSLSGGYQHLATNKKSSWGVSYGYTNLELVFSILKQRPEYFKMPEFHTGDANFRIRTSSTGMLKYYGYFSGNKLGVRNPSIDAAAYKEAFRLKNFNVYHNLAYKENLGGLWKLQAGVSYSNNKDDIRGALENTEGNETTITGLEQKNFDLELHGNYFNGKAVFERRLTGLSAFRIGSEYNFSRDKTGYTVHGAQTYNGLVTENLLSAFAESDIYLTNALAAKIGTRVEHSALLKKFNLAPRISLAYKTGASSQASVAYGIFYQNPERKYMPAASPLGFTKATHYIAQYQKLVARQTFRVEVFYKKYEDLLKTGFINNRSVGVDNNGYGYAKGFEIFYRDKKSIKNLDFWISYSYLDTKRDFLNYPQMLQPGFAAKHTANLVVKKFVSPLKSMFNANYVIASGRPYYNFRYDNTAGKFEMADKGHTIPYNSLSFSINYLPNVFKKGAAQSTVFVFSITNVLGSNQVFGYQYSADGLKKEAIRPPARSFIFIGAFLSFGVDRSEDVINSNL